MSERWMPKLGERYYFVSSCGKAAGATCDTLERHKDRPYWFGNCYQTRTEAEITAERVRRAYLGETTANVNRYEQNIGVVDGVNIMMCGGGEKIANNYAPITINHKG